MSFTGGADGDNPYAGLIFDAAGNLYGTTLHGGQTIGVGVVFKLTPNSDGTWTESVLYNFSGGADGALPRPASSSTRPGIFTARQWRRWQQMRLQCGTVFKLTPNSDGSWTESVLHSFSGHATEADPTLGLIFDAAGNLYGTTDGGGTTGAADGLQAGSELGWKLDEERAP